MSTVICRCCPKVFFFRTEKKISVRTEKKIQLVYNWIFIPVWNECWNGNFKKPVEINRGLVSNNSNNSSNNFGLTIVPKMLVFIQGALLSLSYYLFWYFAFCKLDPLCLVRSPLQNSKVSVMKVGKICEYILHLGTAVIWWEKFYKHFVFYKY